MNEILSWLSLPETDRPHLIAAVMDEPGKTGLNVGPSNENEVRWDSGKHVREMYTPIYPTFIK